MEPTEIIVFSVLGVVALLIVGSLGNGTGSYLYNLNNVNATVCATYNVTNGTCQTMGANNQPVGTISGTVLPILFMVALVIGFVYYIKK